MGVVYLARDPRLNRSVAIKVLPDALAQNPESLARFEREAKLLAALNHPNIASIYGTEEAGGHRLLVLEYVPGETLASRIARGPLPLDEALDVCRQIALAIEAAHEGGIIHRDLKPGNVKVTPDGQVKVLDFGLAKGGAAASGAELAQSPTLTYSPTGIGVILGTAGYMSPEQARGKLLDRRTDIWSFGCVLFECLAGRQIFEGETVSDTIARILEREPEWAALPAQTPPKIRELLRRCLEKDVRKRQRDIGDARIELEEALAARSSTSRIAVSDMPSAKPRARWPVWLAAAALLLAIGAAGGVAVWKAIGASASTVTGPVRLSVTIPSSIRATYVGFTATGSNLLMFGFPKQPDGTEGRRAQVYFRPFDHYEFKPIPGTDGATSYWRSPEGRWLAIRALVSEQSSQARLLKVPLDGSSPPVALGDWEDDWEDLVWLENDDLLILAETGASVFRLPSGGGARKPPVKIDTGQATGIASLQTGLPGDRGVFLRMESWGPRGYQQDLWMLDPDSGKASRIIENASSPIYVRSGHVVFSRNTALMAVPFDLQKQALAGDVVALTDGLRANTWANAEFEISESGHLTYAPGGLLGADRQLIAVDPSGVVTPFNTDKRPFESALRASRDGKRVAVVVPNAKGTYETWVGEANRPGLTRALTLPNADCSEPVWSPDGQLLAYSRFARDKDDGVYLQRVGSGEPARLILALSSRQEFVSPTSWLPDGSGIVVTKFNDGKPDLVLVPLSSSGEPGRVKGIRSSPAAECCGRVSPDGQLIAFESDESGRHEVQVAAFGAGGTIGPPLVITSGGGNDPVWSADSRRVFYRRNPDKLMAVAIDTKPALRAEAPVLVHDFRKLRVDPSLWDVLPDGRVLAVQRGEGEDDLTSFNIVLNWFDEMRGRVSRSSGRGR